MFDLLKGSFKKMQTLFARTGSLLGQRIRALFGGKVDEETLEQLEEILYEADLGVETATDLTDEIRTLYRQNPNASVDDALDHLKQRLLQILQTQPISVSNDKPTVILVVGVNGNGKTTSVAKLAHIFGQQRQKVVLGAADTFRAAAIDQLTQWSQKLGTDLVHHKPGSDPSAVVYDAISAGKARGADKVIIDTSGRLHTKSDLMEELAKMRRVCEKVHPTSPHETLLVLDATTGQNAVDQAKTFHKFTPITGLLLTKLDGTARGGIVVAIQRALQIPVKYIGIGEGIDDLQPFDPQAFVDTLFK